MKNNHGFIIIKVVKILFFILHIDYNLYNQFYYTYHG